MAIFDYFKNLFNPSAKVKSPEGLRGMERADTLLHNLWAAEKLPGMSVTIIKNGQTVLQKGYGYADLDLKTPVYPKQSLFRIASISKCITAMALGKMVEEGLVDWDASFYDYVPYYPKKKYDFTLRQLAGHTAGIRGYRGKEFALNRPYSIKDGIQVFGEDPLIFEPDKDYLYNSFDSVLLSLAMQEASGVPFQDYVKEKVLLPLGMEDTFPPIGDAQPVEAPLRNSKEKLRLAPSDTSFYTKRGTGFKKAITVNNFYKLAGGGYLSTSDDIAKLGQAILNGDLLKPETYRELHTPQTVNGNSTYYGLGFQVSQDAQGRHFVGHVGSSVGAYTNFFVYPDQQLVVAILINCTDSKVQEELNHIVKTIFME